jgi:FkbM family methyltransferase
VRHACARPVARRRARGAKGVIGVSSQRLAKATARTLLHVRERFFPRTEFRKFPIAGRLIRMLLGRARSPVVENVHGHHRMFVDERDSMGLSIDPLFEPLETEFCSAMVRPGAVVVDIGANIGYYTLIFASRVGPSGKVIAFEPDADNFRLLGANVAENHFTNVTANQAAISNVNERLELYRNEVNRMDHRTYDPGEGWHSVTVRALRLDDYFPAGARRVDLIKMDIQGSEPKALGGMTGVLTENPGIVLVTELWPYGLRRGGHDPAAFLARLQELGFQFSEIDERRKSIASATADGLLGALDENDKWSATNLVCTRGPLSWNR